MPAPRTKTTLDEVQQRYLVEVAASSAYDKLKRDETRWRSLFTVVVAGLTVLGFSRLSDMEDNVSGTVNRSLTTYIDDKAAVLRNDMDGILKALVLQESSQLRSELSKLADEKIGSVLENLEKESRLAHFLLLSTKISLQDSFENIDRDSAMSHLRFLSAYPVVTRRPEFLGAILAFVTSLYQAHHANYRWLDEIAALILEKEITMDSALLQVLLYHFSRTIPLRPDPPQEYVQLVHEFLAESEKLNLLELSEFVRLSLNYNLNRKRTLEGAESIRRIGNIPATEKISLTRNTESLLIGVGSGQLDRQEYVSGAFFYVSLDELYEGELFRSLGIEDASELQEQVRQKATSIQ